MLDKQTAYLLYVLNNFCGDGAYKVLEIKDILEKLPNKFRVDKSSLGDLIEHLQEREYVKVKYNDESVYCLTTLPKGKLFGEKTDEIKKDKKKQINLSMFAVLAGAIGGFIGAVLGSIFIRLFF